MRRVRDILRMRFEADLSLAQISSAVRLSKSAVRNCLQRFERSGLHWPLPQEQTDSSLEALLYHDQDPPSASAFAQPDWQQVIAELARPHVTLELLHQEYCQTHGDRAMSRSSFYRHLNQYRHDHLPPTMRLIHKGGDKLFVDYSGDGLVYIRRDTGEVIDVELFVCCWGASSYSYAEATHTQALPDWIGSHNRAFAYFGCVPHVEVPDNTKAAVSRADFYDPQLNPLYAKLAEHYDMVVLPARVRKPRDKAVVESNVLHLQRFILGSLRNRQFFSLEETNQAISELLEIYNSRPMKIYKVSRRQRFETLDKPFAQPLPADIFRYTDYKNPTVAPDYHVEYEKHYYSVPYTLCGHRVDLYRIDGLLEIYHDTKHLCRHRVCPSDYQFSTCPQHMPPNHQYVRGWSAAFFEGQAQSIGPFTTEVVKLVMQRRKHPEQGYRSAKGIVDLARHYPTVRFERACQRALHFRCANRKTIISILEKGLETRPLADPQPARLTVVHGNLRGAQYYAQQTSEQLTLSI